MNISKHLNKIQTFLKFQYKSISKQKQILPDDKESLEALLSAMNIETGREYKVKQSILNLNREQYNDLSFEQGKFLKINDKHIGQIQAVHKDIITLFLTDKVDKINIEQVQQVNFEKINKNDFENLKGKINYFDAKDKTMQKLLMRSISTSKLTKKYANRKDVDEPIYTGLGLIDFVNPLYKGNFHLFKGNSRSGHKQLLQNLSKQNDDTLNVSVFFSKKDAEEFYNSLVNPENFVIFTLNENTEAEFYYLPRLALNFIHEYIDLFADPLAKQKLNIVLCFNDLANYFIKESSLFNLAKQYPGTDILAEIFETCGNFKNYSMTSFNIVDMNVINLEFRDEFNKYLNKIESFADYTLTFETNLKYLKKYLPQVPVTSLGLINKNIHTNYVNYHIEGLRDLISLISQSHTKQEDSALLRIKLDPWDNYLYYDSKVLLDLLYFNPFSSIENAFIALKFVLYLHSNDYSAHLKGKGERIGKALIAFVENQTNFDEIKYFLNKILKERVNLKEDKIDQFEELINETFRLFIEELKTKNAFSEYKEDYFNLI